MRLRRAERTLAAELELGAPGLDPEPDGGDAAGEVRSFAALGDSFTAGTGCEPGECWADRLAASLRRRRPDLLYRNLAFTGATSAATLDQVGEAIELEPDLVTLIAGANDVLESTRPDPGAIVAQLARGLDALHRAVPGALIVTATMPERWRFVPLRPRTRARVAAGIEGVNAGVRRLAAARGLPCLDVASHPGLAEPENFCPDGLHPSAVGHARAAAAFSRLLQAHTGSNAWTAGV